MSSIPNEFAGVTAVTKANVYFDGKVVSHSVLFPDGSKKTLGLIYPGDYHFGTAGGAFDVPANSGFRILVTEGICEYICSFIEG